MNEQGVELLREGHTEQALDKFAEAYGLAPHSVDVPRGMGTGWCKVAVLA